MRMASRDVIVIGTSAGGVEVLTELVRGLPAGLPASLFIVCHFPTGWRSLLPSILSRAGKLLAAHPADGDPFYPGHIYVAPPDRHLLLAPEGRMRVVRGPRENHHRPAIDPLFRTAARYYGPRVVGVVLTGALNDGAAGLLAVRSAGGLSVVQDPADALMAAMPLNASRVAGADYLVPASGLAPLLAELVHRPESADGGPLVSDPIDTMPQVVRRDMEEQAHNQRGGSVSVFTCPECGGALWQVGEKELIRFRCHVGHVYNGEALFADQAEALEAALWTAVRTFKEKIVLCRQLAQQESARGASEAAARFAEQGEQAGRYADLIQRHILEGPAPGAEADGPAPTP